MGHIDRDTLIRRRDAVLNTYQECQSAQMRAALVALSLTFDGQFLRTGKVWDHIEFVEWATTGSEAVQIDWHAIDGAGWSTTEQVVIRTAADLAGYPHAVSAPATVGDLGYLDDRNFAGIAAALREARSDGPSPTIRADVTLAFDRLLDVWAVA